MRSLGTSLAMLAALSLAGAALAEPPPVLLGAWGTSGTALGQFNGPTGVTFDAEGHVVVADSRNGRIQLFETDGSPVEVLRRPGTAEAVMHPQSVGADHLGRVYATDAEGNCVWVFERGGMPVDDWGGPGSAPGQFLAPGAVDATPYGQVFVADWGNRRIQQLNGSGACNCEWTPAGVGPFSVACDHLGHVFVADRDGNTISKYSCTGTLLESWGGRGREAGQFTRPHAIACDARGNVYVADTYNYRIQKFDNHGRFLTTWGSFGHGDGQFVKAASIAVDQNGLIAVTDEALDRVQVFGRPPHVKAFLDVMPGACPNLIESGAAVQVALLGTESFDALLIDPATVRFASLSPARFAVGDVSRPAADPLDPCACTEAGADGVDDLVFTFDADAVRSALGSDGPHGVALTGALRDGTPFTAQGCIEIGEFARPMDQRDRTPVRVYERTPAGYEIGFTMGEDARARLTVLDVGGRIVDRVLDGWCVRGEHRIAWRPQGLRSGVYFLRFEAGGQVAVQRFPLAR